MVSHPMKVAQVRIALSDALHVKAAEYWLKLGEPMEALLELRQVSGRARRHPWAEQVFLGAFGRLRVAGV